jgi:hypothetical protein
MVVFFTSCNSRDQANKAITWEENIERKCEKELKTILRDPDSYQNINWKLINIENECEAFNEKYPDYHGVHYKWELINNYRSKNGFGGYNFGEAYFLIDTADSIQFYERNLLPSFAKP